ncbi:MAG TPA: M48 family metallopeptidase [Polyangia bacterium]
MTDGGDLFEQQRANRRGTAWLMLGFVAFFAWLGFGGDFVLREMTRDAAAGEYHHLFPWITIGTVALSVIAIVYAWSTGPQNVLWATGARLLEDPATPEAKQLANVVEEMAIASGLPVPNIYIVPDADPNAFATGWNEESSSIVVTEGLLQMCSRDELQAVIGHEMGHIKNLDIRLMTLLAALVGVAALINDGASRLLRSSGDSSSSSTWSSSSSSGSSSSSSRKGGGGTIVLIVAVVWILSILLAPLITRLLALAVSRKREFLADAMSAQFTRNPGALANALVKIDGADAPTTSINRGVAHLCIADPLGRSVNGRPGFFADLFGTHPPVEERVERLREMAYEPGPAGEPVPAG